MAIRTTVIASCTSRKALGPASQMQLRSVPPGDRLTEWVTRLESAVPVASPSELYRGEAWSQSLALTQDVRSAHPYVLSAGYGLVALDAAIAPYSATLSPGHADSVARHGGTCRQENAAWMTGLRAWPGHLGDGPRSIADVARARPTDPIIVCLGRTYVDAVASDLREAAGILVDPELLSVFASGAPAEGLGESWVTVPGSLRLVLGGTLGSTITRTARAVVQTSGHGPLVASVARDRTAQMRAEAPALPNHRRRRLSDDVVREWIGSHLRGHPAASVSGALTTLRREGMACEQGRFRILFEDVMDIVP